MSTDTYNAARMRIYRKNMTDEQKEHRRAYQRAYYEAHKEESLAYCREHRSRRKDKDKQRTAHALYMREWRLKKKKEKPE